MTIQGNELFYGTYTSDGNSRIIEFSTDVTSFMLLNQTNFNSVANPGVIKRAWFVGTLDDGQAFGVQNTNAAATDQSIFLATGGFTPFSFDDLPTFAAVNLTSITAANPGVVTTAAPHLLRTGDIVTFINSDMLEVDGLKTTVTVTGASTFTIYNTTGFTAGGAQGSIRRIAFQKTFAPRTQNIVAITQAASAVVTTAVDHGYQVDDAISFRVSAGYGMSEINNLTGNITAVTASTFTVDIDSSGFTAFAFPATASVFSFSRPVSVPVGAAGTSPNFLGDATTNIGFKGLELGATVVGANNDVVHWVASRGLLIT